ncbi:MAG TPA: hypothetical protein VLJ79_20650 [Candidatus Binatia bacterium]|nr:hypothetical protein [Candidatus Binatia bacterium]
MNGVWQPAVNLGPNVNSPYSDHHSLPSPDGKSLYVTSARPGGFGGEDIYVTTRDDTGAWVRSSTSVHSSTPTRIVDA